MKGFININCAPQWLKKYVVLFLVVLGWIIFRSENCSSTFLYYRCLFDFSEYLSVPSGWSNLASIVPFSIKFKEMPYFYGKSEIFYLLCLFLIAVYGVTSQSIVEKLSELRENRHILPIFLIVLALFSLSLYHIDRQSEFIYFQF